MPRRIRLSRRAGWRKPAGAVVVSRPSRWGNPFPVGDDRPLAVANFRAWVEGRIEADRPPPTRDEIVAGLRAKDLACWCPPDEPCHADVLMEIANG